MVPTHIFPQSWSPKHTSFSKNKEALQEQHSKMLILSAGWFRTITSVQFCCCCWLKPDFWYIPRDGLTIRDISRAMENLLVWGIKIISQKSSESWFFSELSSRRLTSERNWGDVSAGQASPFLCLHLFASQPPLSHLFILHLHPHHSLPWRLSSALSWFLCDPHTQIDPSFDPAQYMDPLYTVISWLLAFY